MARGLGTGVAADSWRRWFALALVCALGLAVRAPSAMAGPKTRREFRQYDLSALGFNDGDPYRVKAAEAEGLLEEPDLKVYEFLAVDWMSRTRKGRLLVASQIAERFPERAVGDLFRLYRFDVLGDRAPEILVVGTPALFELGVRLAPTLLAVEPTGLQVVWHGGELLGDRFRVADMRDLNGDLEPELLLVGEAGQGGAWQFMALIGHGVRGFQQLVAQSADSFVYLDLDRDGKVEIVHHERVGRRGTAHQWTYIDTIWGWSGEVFLRQQAAFPRYHDEETLPALIGQLIDQYDARRAVLDEKVEAIRRVRGETMTGRQPPPRFDAKRKEALTQAQKLKTKQARASLEALVAAWPFDVEVQLALARILEQERAWPRAIEAATRAISLEPGSREAWLRASMILAKLQERSSAVACAVLSVVLGGDPGEGLAYLKAHRGEAGTDPDLQGVLDEALRELDARR